jgi:thymidine kinase
MSPQIEIITGPMFAGKSTMLIKRIREDNYPETSKLLFNFAGDKRYNENADITTHNKDTIPSIPITDFFELNKHITHNIKAIYIDEVQFLKSLTKWLDNSLAEFSNLKTIILAGLNFDIYGNNFNNELNLLTHNEKIIKHYLRGNCYICKEKAYYTISTLENNKKQQDNTTNKVHVCVGTKDMYQPVCLLHALKAPYNNNFKRFITKYT